MNTTNDPIQLLRDVRSDVAGPSREAELLAREALFARRPKRGRAFVAIAVCCLALVGALALIAPWTRTQNAQAAVDDLADTAAAQPLVKIGPNDWIVSRYTTRYSWTQNLTQERLDALTARAVAVAGASGNDGHYLRSNRDNAPLPEKTVAKIDRQQQRRTDRIRKGVELSSLPATRIEAFNEASYQEARNAAGIGGGGGGDNTIHYATPEQAEAGKILQRAGIGGNLANPMDFGGAEIASLASRAVENEADVEDLRVDPERMREQLARWRPITGLGEAPKAGSTPDLFGKVAGVVSSPYATPRQRAAAIRLAATLPGVAIEQKAHDARGREGLGMAVSIPGGTMQFIFREQDSQLLGMIVKIDDPRTFVGDSYTLDGKRKVPVLPPYDTATIAVSFDKWGVSRGKPPCTPSFCTTGPNPTPEELARVRRMAGVR